MFGRKDQFKTARLRQQICTCLLGDVCRVIVQDKANAPISWVLRVKDAEKLHELSTTMAIFHQRNYHPVVKIYPRQKMGKAS